MMLSIDNLVKRYGNYDNIDTLVKAVNIDYDIATGNSVYKFMKRIANDGFDNGTFCYGYNIADNLIDSIDYQKKQGYNQLLIDDDKQALKEFNDKGYNSEDYIFDNDCTEYDEPNNIRVLIDYYKEYMK